MPGHYHSFEFIRLTHRTIMIIQTLFALLMRFTTLYIDYSLLNRIIHTYSIRCYTPVLQATLSVLRRPVI